MRPEVNNYLQRFRAVEQEGITLLVDDIVELLGAKEPGVVGAFAENLNGKTMADLVCPSLLDEWQEFLRQINLDYIGLERVRSNLQLRLSEAAGRMVVVDSNEVYALNFGFNIPSLSIHPRPILSLVRDH
ncbi:hypothetical protein D3C87_1608300 [compost metagenome]